MNAVTTAPARRFFDSDATKTIGEAFDLAWDEVKKDLRYSDVELAGARQYLASRIFELAERGERNPAKLRDFGLAIFRL